MNLRMIASPVQVYLVGQSEPITISRVEIEGRPGEEYLISDTNPIQDAMIEYFEDDLTLGTEYEPDEELKGDLQSLKDLGLPLSSIQEYIDLIDESGYPVEFESVRLTRGSSLPPYRVQ